MELKNNNFARSAITFSQITSRRSLSGGTARSAQKNQVAEQIYEKTLGVHSCRFQLAAQYQKTLLSHPARQHQQIRNARCFCETILAVTTRRYPADRCATWYCVDNLTDRPSNQTRYFSVTSVRRIHHSSST